MLEARVYSKVQVYRHTMVSKHADYDSLKRLHNLSCIISICQFSFSSYFFLAVQFLILSIVAIAIPVSSLFRDMGTCLLLPSNKEYIFEKLLLPPFFSLCFIFILLFLYFEAGFVSVTTLAVLELAQ